MAEARPPTNVGLRRKKNKCVTGRHQKAVAKLGSGSTCVVVSLVVEIPGRLWGGLRSGYRSPRCGAQTFIEAAMSLHPEGRIDLDWLSGIQALQREGFQFFFRSLIGLDEAFDVGGNRHTL